MLRHLVLSPLYYYLFKLNLISGQCGVNDISCTLNCTNSNTCASSVIECPLGEDCEECIINCGEGGCTDSEIYGNYCQNTIINCIGDNGGDGTIIYAPTNLGNLTLNVIRGHQCFRNNFIYTGNNMTYNYNNNLYDMSGFIKLNCNDSTEADDNKENDPRDECKSMRVYATYALSLEYHCRDEAKCEKNHFYCPNNEHIIKQDWPILDKFSSNNFINHKQTACLIDCSESGSSQDKPCSETSVFTTYDNSVTWICDDNSEFSCLSSTLHCNYKNSTLNNDDTFDYFYTNNHGKFCNWTYTNNNNNNDSWHCDGYCSNDWDIDTTTTSSNTNTNTNTNDDNYNTTTISSTLLSSTNNIDTSNSNNDDDSNNTIITLTSSSTTGANNNTNTNNNNNNNNNNDNDSDSSNDSSNNNDSDNDSDSGTNFIVALVVGIALVSCFCILLISFLGYIIYRQSRIHSSTIQTMSKKLDQLTEMSSHQKNHSVNNILPKTRDGDGDSGGDDAIFNTNNNNSNNSNNNNNMKHNKNGINDDDDDDENDDINGNDRMMMIGHRIIGSIDSSVEDDQAEGAPSSIDILRNATASPPPPPPPPPRPSRPPRRPPPPSSSQQQQQQQQRHVQGQLKPMIGINNSVTPANDIDIGINSDCESNEQFGKNLENINQGLDMMQDDIINQMNSPRGP